MKRVFGICLLALLLPLCALAADFDLDETAVFTGMNSRSWLQGYEPTIQTDVLTLCMPITSQWATGRITATLIPANEAISPFRPQDFSLGVSPVNGVYQVTLALKLHKTRQNGDYACTLRVEGKDAEGNWLVTDFPLTIRIRDGQSAGIVQRPLLSNVSGTFKTGEAALFTATLTNPSAYCEMTDILMTVSDASGDILPSGSNKLVLPTLLPGESTQIAYPLTVLPGAKISPHTLIVDISYRALEQPHSWQESFTLPVIQDIRLEHGGIEMATSVIQGDMATLSLPLMNLGKGDLKNVMVTLSLPGITERQSVLVGAIASGESKQAKLTFRPGSAVLGEVSGEVTVTGEDTWGNPTEFSLPVAITVEASAPTAAPTVLAQEKETSNKLTYILGAVCGLLALLLIAQGIWLKSKINRLEEEKL